MTGSSPTRLPGAFLVILSGMVAALHIGKVPPAIPVLRDALDLTLVEAGFLLSMVQMAGMLGGVLMGLLADVIGLRRSVIIGQAVLATASLVGMWAVQPSDLLILRAVEGLGFLLVTLPVPSLLRQLVPPSRLALHLGLWGTYMATGTSLALVGGPLVIRLQGWEGLWGMLAVVSAAAAVWVVARVPSDRVRRARAGTPASASVRVEPWWARLRATLTSAGPWRAALIFAVYSSQWIAVIGFLPSIYAQAGLGGQVAGALTAFASLVNVTGNVAAGRLLHGGVSARRVLYVGFVSMALASFVAFGQPSADLPVLRYVAVLVFSAVGGLIPATMFALAVHVAPSERTVSTTVGLIQQCSSTGQFLGPPLLAWVAVAVGGWHWTWVVTSTASLCGLLLARGVSFDRH